VWTQTRKSCGGAAERSDFHEISSGQIACFKDTAHRSSPFDVIGGTKEY
jgi:hypothetical protein